MHNCGKAKKFVCKYGALITYTLLKLDRDTINKKKILCVRKSLESVVSLTKKDVSIQVRRGLFTEIFLLNEILCNIFNGHDYFNSRRNETISHHDAVDFPNIRIDVIMHFHANVNFQKLAIYIKDPLYYKKFKNHCKQVNDEIYVPCLILVHAVLQVLCDTIIMRGAGSLSEVALVENNDTSEVVSVPKDCPKANEIIGAAKAVMEYIYNINFNDLDKHRIDDFSKIIEECLQKCFDQLMATDRKSSYEFYEFWREYSIKLIDSDSPSLKLFGWQQVSRLLHACTKHAPPPQQYVVKGDGCTFLNGIYHYSGIVTADGYAKFGTNACYARINGSVNAEGPNSVGGFGSGFSSGKIPSEVTNNLTGLDVSGLRTSCSKKLLIFKRTMRSKQQWWFLSEADEEPPGTDRAIDYYKQVVKKHNADFPSSTWWITCKPDGVTPAPIMEAQGLMVPL